MISNNRRWGHWDLTFDAPMTIIQRNPDLPIGSFMILVLGIIGVSTGSIFARLADAPALVTAAYRVGLAAMILVPLAIWKARDELRDLSLHEFKLATFSGFFLALHFASWISSLDYTAIANSVVLVNTIPLWVGLLTPLIAKDRLKRATVISIIVMVRITPTSPGTMNTGVRRSGLYRGSTSTRTGSARTSSESGPKPARSPRTRRSAADA